MANEPLEGDSNSGTIPAVLGTNTATTVSSGAQAPAVVGNSATGVGVSASTQNTNENAIFGINNATGQATQPANAIAGCGIWGHYCPSTTNLSR
jgi:hypothetical protein